MDNARFNAQPTLDGSLILLRPLALADHEALFKVASDPLIWAQHPSKQRYQRAVFDEQILKPAMEGQNTLVALDKQTHHIIGASRYYEVDVDKRELAIGYTFLARSHWGGAFNAEMKKCMLDHAFTWAEKVWFHVGSENIRSQKAMEKIGGKRSHMEPWLGTGQSIDHVYFYITKADWLARPPTAK